MRLKRFKYFTRATTILVALFLATPAAFAVKAETYQDVIEKAFNLSLQKERSQAIALLVSVAQKESKKGQAPKELLSALEEISTVFYSDKAQQSFELGLSLRISDPGLAQSKFAEALGLEPENLQILIAQLRLQIAANDCGNAQKQTQKLLEKNPYSEDLQLILAQAGVCLGRSIESLKPKPTGDGKKTSGDIFWLILEIENQFRLAQFAKAREVAEQAAHADPAFPETNYWSWKISMAQKIKNDRAGQKYLNSCKSLSARAQRNYIKEPSLCRRTSEVEAEIKKTNAVGEP